jgi:predicted nucleic acid-binding Zn finger protein
MSEGTDNTMAYRPRIMKVDEGEFYVEGSPERKFCYRTIVSDEEKSCSCGDYSMKVKKDPDYVCEHIEYIQAALEGNFGAKDIEIFEKRRPARLDERFIKNIQGRDFVVYAGLLDLAHQSGIRSMRVEAVQFPTSENGLEAICKATVETESGELFTEVGDANPKNVNPMIAKHVLRMAATRAKARALRDYTNIGMTCLEELDDDDVIPETKSKSQPLRFEPRGKESVKKPPVKIPKQESKENPDGEPAASTPPLVEPSHAGSTGKATKPSEEDSKEKFTAKLSSAQLKAIENLARRRGMNSTELASLALETFGRKTLDALTQVEASSLIRTLQQSA